MTLVATLFVLAAPAAFGADYRYTVSAAGGQSLRTRHGQMDIASISLEAARDVAPKWELAGVGGIHTIHQPRSWFGDEFGDGDENVYGASVSLLLRRRFGSLFYAEAGTGPMYATKAVPASTSRFNFVSQLGAGVTLFRNARTPLTVGYRFQHISNGGYSPRNPGVNVNSLVVGVRVRR